MNDIQALVDTNEPEVDHGYQYDLIVIGGGSGGLACSKAAAELGKKVAVVDFVRPSPQGTTWGLGGTCVNVGCIPKKLMHHASLLGESIHDAKHYGWQVPDTVQHNWETLVQAVQDHIGSLNWGYRVQLRDKKVDYINAYAVFVDPHTIECTNRAKKVTRYTARRYVLAMGGRPKFPPDVPGAKEYCISSDDLFSMSKPPGKTLVVGASYVALECAGFVSGLGYSSTVMARSILLRGFDQQMAEMIGEYMKNHGTTIIRPAIPLSVEKLESGRLKVAWKVLDQPASSEASDEFDTVMFATGRDPETRGIGLDKAGVVDDPATGKVPVVHERTNVPHIYAIGDVILGTPELTPVAIQAGRLLAMRLYGGSKTQMDYINVPTTVFTPIEYGAVGYSEEAAVARFGADNVEVYHAYIQPLEWTVPHRPENDCYCKLICNKLDNERVVGFHVLGPNAGEITQGFSVAIKAGATKEHFDTTIGIHPTVAEEFTKLDITKRSGQDAKKSGC